MMTCAYYRMRLDASLWALRVDAVGRIHAAVGPLTPAATTQPPMAHHADVPVDVAGWELAAFCRVSDLWTLRDKVRLQRGLGVRRVDLQQDRFGFELRLLPA